MMEKLAIVANFQIKFWTFNMCLDDKHYKSGQK